MFALNSLLEKDCVVVGDLPLCRMLLVNNRRFPWLILVPKREHLRELFDLNETDYTICTQEIRATSRQLAAFTKADKINVAALGNIVPQLHIHIIARFETDSAWPQPVWNAPQPTEPYGAQELSEMLEQLRKIITV